MSSGDQEDLADTEIFPKPNECVHTASYCEENVWKLCEHIQNHHPEKLKNCYAAFVSNKDRQIPIWHQRTSQREDRLVIWDYHVILLYNHGEVHWVYDLDTELPCPCRLNRYMDEAIRNDSLFREDFRRWFRLVRGDEYLSTFASDRSHMLKEDGTWMAEPPSYPCISTSESKNNIQDFISMEQSVGVGTVYSSSELRQKFS